MRHHAGVASVIGEIGTIEWCRRTNGILGRGESARYRAAALMRFSAILPRMLVAHAGMRGSGPDPSELTPPDTPFTREVLDACRDLGPMVIEHGYRSYIFGRALGALSGVECDKEALFAATMFHDYAFARLDKLAGECFSYAGAKAAEDVLASSTLEEWKRHDVLDAITQHLNPKVPASRGAIQHLVHDGVLLDLLGVRAWELDPKGIGRVFERYPRQGFTAAGARLLRAHAKRVPGTRTKAAFTCGFGVALRISLWRAADRVNVAPS
jgi:hypothetical protein